MNINLICVCMYSVTQTKTKRKNKNKTKPKKKQQLFRSRTYFFIIFEICRISYETKTKVVLTKKKRMKSDAMVVWGGIVFLNGRMSYNIIKCHFSWKFNSKIYIHLNICVFVHSFFPSTQLLNIVDLFSPHINTLVGLPSVGR